MNARQAAKHYKKKYKELSNILSTKIIQPNVTYYKPDVIQFKELISIPKIEYCKDEFEYKHNLTHAKYDLIHKIQDDISSYIQIEKEPEYYIKSQYNETYIAKIDILDWRNY